MLAIKFGCKKMRRYFYGKLVTVFTDHKPLLGLFKKNGKHEIENSRVQNYLLDVAEFNLNPHHMGGRKMSWQIWVQEMSLQRKMITKF